MVLSGAGWYMFAVAAGGTSTSDSAVLAASARAGIGQAIGEAPSVAVISGTTLTLTDLARVIAAHAAAIKASRTDATALGTVHSAATGDRQDDSATLAHSANPAVSASNESLLLAILLASYRAEPTDGVAFSNASSRTSVAHRAADLAPLIDAWAQRFDQSSHSSMAEGVVAGSASIGVDAAAIEELSLAALGAEGLDGLAFAAGTAQSFQTHSMPSVASSALTALGFSRADAGSIAERTLALLGHVISESTTFGDDATTAQGISDPFGLHDMGIALMAAAYVEAGARDTGGYLVEVAASALEATATERNTIDHPAAGMLRSVDHASMNDQNTAATTAGYPRSETVGTGSQTRQRVGGLTSTRNTSVGAVANQRPAFLRTDSSSIVAGTKTGIAHRRAAYPRLHADVEVRSARHPYATIAVRSTLAARLARASMTEPLRLQADPASSIRGPISDAQSLSETATFVVTNAGPKVVATATGQPTPPVDGALAPAGIAPQTGIVPPQTARASTTQEEVLSVVWPTQPATLEARRYGVTLNVPAGARSAVFQTRVTVESAEALEVPPAGEVLRVVRIEIFDALGRPLADPSPEKPLDLVIRLGSDEIGRIDPGRADLRPGPDAVKLQRFEPGVPESGLVTAGVWLDIPLREWSGDSVSASLDHLSLFALVASPRRGAEDGAGGQTSSVAPGGDAREDAREVSIVQGHGRTMPRFGGPLTVMIAAGGTIVLGVIAVFGGRFMTWLMQLIRCLRRRSSGTPRCDTRSEAP